MSEAPKTNLSSFYASTEGYEGDGSEFVFAKEITETVMEGPNGPIKLTDPIVCDFCMDTRVEWSYPAESFEVPGGLGGSLGWWGSCDLCSALIEEDDRSSLARRSVRSWELRHGDGVPLAVVLHSITGIQDGFFRHRTGPRRRPGGRFGLGER